MFGSPPNSGVLIALTGLAVLLLVLLTVRWKLQPFIAMMLVSLGLGLAAGMPPLDVVHSFQTGVGSVLGSITIIIALGAVLGRMLVHSGGAESIARTIVERLGERRLHWAMALIAFLVGLPVFFAVGFVLLVPILFSVTRESGQSFLLLAIPLLAGLATVHTIVPPHPGIMAAIGLVGADVGRTLLGSLAIGLPVALLAGPGLGVWYGRRVPAGRSSAMPVPKTDNGPVSNPTSFAPALFTILTPVALMLLSTVADLLVAPDSSFRRCADFVGNANVALVLAVLLSFYTFGKARGLDRRRILELAEQSLGPIASVLLIIGAGGGFSSVLVACGVGDAVAGMTRELALPPIVLGWLIAAGMRVATGSATVAVTAAAGIVGPLAAADPQINRELMVLALGSGSLIFSHVNDGGFWLVKEFYGMTVLETFKTWTALTTILSLLLLGLVLLLDSVL